MTLCRHGRRCSDPSRARPIEVCVRIPAPAGRDDLEPALGQAQKHQVHTAEPTSLSVSPSGPTLAPHLAAIAQAASPSPRSVTVREGLARLRDLGAAGCCVVGHPEYYRELRFENPSGLWVDSVPPNVFLALALNGPVARGAVAFHDGFKADEQTVAWGTAP